MIKKSLRFLMAGGLCAVSMQSGAIATGPVELILQRTSGQEIQRIALESWVYDQKSTTLFAESMFGGYRCQSAPDLGQANHYLALDNGIYSLVSVNTSSVQTEGVIYATPVATLDDFAACRPALATQVQPKGPNTDLTMDVISNGFRQLADVPIIGGFSMALGGASGPAVVAQLNANMICFDGNNQAMGTVELEDMNGIVQDFRGATPTSLTFATGAANSLAFNTLTTLSCFDMSQARSVQNGAAVCPDLQVDGDLFMDGFESNVFGGWNTQVAVGVRVIETPAGVGDSLMYEVSVRNCTEQTLSNVALRGYFDDGVLDANSSAWGECTGSTCTAADFTVLPNSGYLRLSNDTQQVGGEGRITLDAGETRAYAVERDLNAVVGSIFLNAIAVVAPGSRAVPAYDAVVIDALANAQPTLSNIGGALGTIDEEENLVVTDVLQALDSDSGFDCDDDSCILISTTNNALLRPTEDITASFNPVSQTISLDITPRKNRSGLVTIQVRVQDAGGATSDPVNLPLEVLEVNDPPYFAVSSGWTPASRPGLDAPGTPGVFQVNTALTVSCPMQQLANDTYQLIDSECPSQDWESADDIPSTQDTMLYDDFVTDLQPGPNETGSVTLACFVEVNRDETPCAQYSDTIFDFVDLKDTGSGWSLGYRLSGAKGEVSLVLRASDGDLETSASVRVSVLNSAPVFTTTGGTFGLDENATAQYMSAAMDDDMDPIAYSLSGPDASLFQLITPGTSGDFEPLAPFDFEAPVDANTDNAYEVTVNADDGFDVVSQNFLIVVADLNEAPVAIADPDEFDIDIGVVNGLVVVDSSALATSFDPDGDKLVRWEITSGNLPVDMGFLEPFDIDPFTGEITVNDNRNFAAETSFVIEITVQDAISGGLTSDPETITVNVNDPGP